MLCVMLIACDKAPRGIIGERKMAQIVADLQVADAYVTTNPDQFDTDSARQALKQSIFAKHGVTAHMYDTSLVWYAHNMDVYTDVYDRAAKVLSDRRNTIEHDNGLASGKRNSKPRHGVGSRKLYSAQGDTANMWNGPIQLIATGGLDGAYYPFEIEPANDAQPGDRYQLSFKYNSIGSKLDLTVAADYRDGSSSIMSHMTTADGWSTTTLQTDTAREVRRIYGYIHYNLTPAGLAMLDSIQLLRMRHDPYSYGSYRVQTNIERRKTTSEK